jgi:hypothetical protein
MWRPLPRRSSGPRRISAIHSDFSRQRPLWRKRWGSGMKWDQIKSTITDGCSSVLTPLGYRYVASRNAYEKSSALERRSVLLNFVATKHPSYSVTLWCGMRNEEMERLFHRTSGVEKHQSTYMTTNFVCGRWHVNTEEEIAEAIGNCRELVNSKCLPFLEQQYAYAKYSSLLNTNPTERCPYHGNSENRCHYGLIAAKLAGDSQYESLKASYLEYMHRSNSGFYLPRFQAFIADLESS